MSRDVPLNLPGRQAGPVLALFAFSLLLPGCGNQRAVPDEAASIERALRAAIRYLVSKQSTDGAWRSDLYGAFRDGAALTGPIVKVLFFASASQPEARASFRHGADYLASFAREDGTLREPAMSLVYPVYTAALASMVIDLEDRSELRARARAAWFRLLLEFRMGRANGWEPEDPVFGGWGYSPKIPRKPAGGDFPHEANLSATLFGIAALRHARVPLDDPVYAEILSFVFRCQNFSADPEESDPRFDDGGFFFTPADPARNKAGIAGKDRHSMTRYNSYGSATSDGLRALLRCGLRPDHPRVAAAQRWIESHFSVEINPGTFTEDREPIRNATYYYYCWSLAHLFMAQDARGAAYGQRYYDNALSLSDALIRRQNPDGSWSNGYRDGREDDPLVATPMAAAALAICNNLLQGGSSRFDDQVVTLHRTTP